MKQITTTDTIGILGAGAMGAGIAQVAATAGHKVILSDSSSEALETAAQKLDKILKRLVEKGRIQQQIADDIYGRITFAKPIENGQVPYAAFKECSCVIEAIIENLEIKQTVFKELEKVVSKEAILATNTSSLSVVSIASACDAPNRVVGIHFFNPAPLMPLVEIVPALTSSDEIVAVSKKLIDQWGKLTVLAKDTPGFIVNRVARPFYGEAIRILEEGMADVATIDWAMKEIGGFRMGPFELMDFIGNDVNYKVTETVFEQFFYDPRYKPSLTQKQLFEAKYFGRKSGKGYYDYSENAAKPKPDSDNNLGEKIVDRIVAMLINEAADALFLNIATREDIDLAMTKGVNYPKGLLAWADEIGIEKVLNTLENLQSEYGEDRYRPSPILRRMTRLGKTFY
jgi:3-hydroxybutyryl-CoA dehydrogenase